MLGVPSAFAKPCEARLTPAADGLAEIGVVAHVAQVEFVDHRGAEGLGVAQREQLRAARGERIEAGNAGAALRDRIRIVEIEVVDEVVAGEQAPAGIRIDADRALVVAHRLVVGGGGKVRVAVFGAGMYCSIRCAGTDQALCGITALGKTHCEE